METIIEDFSNIQKVAGEKFWIDMEGKIRTNDLFDLTLCEQILETISRLN